MSGTLFVVATPIGNLSDLSARALETLRTVDAIAAEDTRHTKALLTHFQIGTPLRSFHAHSGESRRNQFLEELALGKSLALVTDAGTPLVSDPGSDLVADAIAAGVRVVPIPGPSAPIAAIVGSGLARDGRFFFAGFLPRKGTERSAALAEIAHARHTTVFFESPERIQTTLADLAELDPSRRVAVAREITKLHEEFVYGTARSLADDSRSWRGEITVVVAPNEAKENAELDWARIDARIDALLGEGVSTKQVASRIAVEEGIARGIAYDRVLARRTQR